MLRLASILYSLIATTLAGSAIVVALTTGYVTWQALLVAAAIGALAAIPISAYVAKSIVDRG